MCKEKCHNGKKSKECKPEQIRECHGDVREHPCEKPESKKQDSDK